MTAQELRAAADRLDEWVGGATSDPWSVGVDPETGERNVVYSEFVATRYPDKDPTVARVTSRQYPEADDDAEAEWGQTADAALIAGMRAVAEPLAEWLREAADEASEPSVLGPAAEAFILNGSPALAVARAINPP